MINWINVKDKLPNESQEECFFGLAIFFVLMAFSDGRFRVGFYDWECGGWRDHDHFLLTDADEVTHWMPIPELPKELIK